MIEKPRLKNYRNGEFIRFCNNVIATVTQNNPDTLLVTALLNTLKTATAEAQVLFNKEKGSTITDDLIALDERRDKAINSVIQRVEIDIDHFDSTLKSHARALKNNLDAHGKGIAKENYQEETTILDKIVSDWSTKPELTAAVTALGLNNWMAELDIANKAFDIRFVERNNQQGAATTQKLKEKRIEITAVYDKLATRIFSHYDINDGAEPFGKTVRELNALVEKYNTELVNRGKGVEVPVTTG